MRIIMKSHPSPIIYSFILSLIIFDNGEATFNYGSLIREVDAKYGTSAIIMATTREYLSFNRLTDAHRISSDLSASGIMSVVVNFVQLGERMEFYRRKIVRPLIVICIGRISGVREFQEATVNIDISYPVWLMLFTGDNNEDSCKFCRNPIGNPFKLKFNSEMLVSCCESGYIEDFWSQTINHTDKLILGQWNDEINGPDWFRNESLYSRRQSVDAMKFRIVIVTGSSYIWKKDDRLDGFLGYVVNELCRVMNFTLSEVIEETSFGSLRSKTSDWTGAVGAVVHGRAHLGVAEFTMTSERLRAVHFTLPIVLGKCRLYIRKPDGFGVHWDAYIEAFHPKVWMVIIILLVTTPLLLTIIKYKRKYNLVNMISEHYLNVWGIFCQQGLSEFPNETSLRIVYFSIFISAIVVSAAYSASLISYLAISSLYLPFNTMEEFADAGTHKLIVFRDSADYDMFKLSNDTVVMKMMKLMKPRLLLPQSLQEGFKQVCTEDVAFFTNEALKQSLNIYLPCEIAHIETGRIDNFGMVMPRDSEYIGLVNYHIQRFQSNGMMKRLKHKFFIRQNSPESTCQPVELWGIVPILAAFTTGFFTSLIIFIIERIYHHYNPEIKVKPRRHRKIMNL